MPHYKWGSYRKQNRSETVNSTRKVLLKVINLSALTLMLLSVDSMLCSQSPEVQKAMIWNLALKDASLFF